MEKSIKNNNIYFKDFSRTKIEEKVEKRYQACWDSNNDSFGNKMETFSKYVKRQTLTRFLAHYDWDRQC